MTDKNKYSFENPTGSSMQYIIEIILSLNSQQLITDYLHNIKRFIIHNNPKNIIKDSSSIHINEQNLTEMATSDFVTVNEFNTILISRFCQGLQNYLVNDIYFKFHKDEIRIRLADYRTLVEGELNCADVKKLFTESNNHESYLRVKNLLVMEAKVGDNILYEREDAIKRICTSLSPDNNVKYRDEKEKFQYFEKQIMNDVQSAIDKNKPSVSLSMMSLPNYKTEEVNNLLENSTLKDIVLNINEEWDKKISVRTVNKNSLTDQYIEMKNKLDEMNLFNNVKKIADILSIDDDYYRVSTLYSNKEFKKIRTSTSKRRALLYSPKRITSEKQIPWKKVSHADKFRKKTLENFRLTHTRNSTLLREEIGLNPGQITSTSVNTKALIGLSFWHLSYRHNSFFQLIDDLESESQETKEQNLLLYHQKLIQYHHTIESELLGTVLNKFIEGAKSHLKSLKSTIRKYYIEHNKLESEGLINKQKKMQAGRLIKKIENLNDKVRKHPLNGNNEIELRNLAAGVIKYHFNYDLLRNVIENYYHSFIGHGKLKNLYHIEDKTI